MKWWHGRKRPDIGGQVARQEAEDHLTEAMEAWPEVRRVSASLRGLRERNEFGEQLRMIYRGEVL